MDNILGVDNAAVLDNSVRVTLTRGSNFLRTVWTLLSLFVDNILEADAAAVLDNSAGVTLVRGGTFLRISMAFLSETALLDNTAFTDDFRLVARRDQFNAVILAKRSLGA